MYDAVALGKDPLRRERENRSPNLFERTSAFRKEKHGMHMILILPTGVLPVASTNLKSSQRFVSLA
jgi:hypothetical protein